MWSFIERKLSEAKTKREAVEAYRAKLATAPICKHCDGEGKVRVRGIRTETGYDTCCYCGGCGKDMSGGSN